MQMQMLSLYSTKWLVELHHLHTRGRPQVAMLQMHQQSSRPPLLCQHLLLCEQLLLQLLLLKRHHGRLLRLHICQLR